MEPPDFDLFVDPSDDLGCFVDTHTTVGLDSSICQIHSTTLNKFIIMKEVQNFTKFYKLDVRFLYDDHLYSEQLFQIAYWDHI